MHNTVLSVHKNNGKTNKTRMMIAFIMAFIILVVPFADAAGTRNMFYTDSSGTLTQNDGCRAFTEWYNADTSGIKRHQFVYVYVNAGEKLLAASSVLGTGKIQYLTADNQTGTIDITEERGYIGTTAKEKAGEFYTNSLYNAADAEPVGFAGDSSGYKAAEITVGENQAGVWRFEFHSKSESSITNPNRTTLSSQTTLTQVDSTVAAWSLMVIKNPESVAPTVVTGRTFSYFLTLNTGPNSTAAEKDRVTLFSSVYVLTNDGYVYKTDFNGIDPYGFIFFANNRGLTVENGTSTASLYASAIDKNSSNSLSNLIYNYPDGSGVKKVYFHKPTEDDTELDQTFKIFFEEPAEDLPETIKPKPYAPGQVSDFRFIGDSSSHGYVGSGGYFYFKVTRASSFQIKMDFSNYWNGSEWVDGGVAYLSNACVDGENRIYWDGKDANGNVVPAGTYGSGSGTGGIKVSIELKAGEYHFPLLDVENNVNGIKIELMNNPLDTNGKPITVPDANKYSVFYDNSMLFAAKSGSKFIYDDNTINSSFVATKKYTAAELQGQYAVKNTVDGVDTSGSYGAAAYRSSTAFSSSVRQGDNSAVDVWTYYKGEGGSSSTELEDFELEDVPVDNDIGKIRGFVYYDSTNLGTFSQSDGDYELPHVTVELWNSDHTVLLNSTKTDIFGEYIFETDSSGNSLKYGSYQIYVYDPAPACTCTTANQTQSVTLDSDLISAPKVGFNYTKINKSVVVYKTWSIDKTYDPSQPDSIQIEIVGKGNGTTYITQSGIVSLANGWKTTFQNLPMYADSAKTIPLTYTVKELMVDAFGNTINGYSSVVSEPTETSKYIEYTVNNTADCKIVLFKSDAGLATKGIQGASFSLYEKDGEGNSTLVKTAVSDENGLVIFDGLKPGTFYYVENAAAYGYVLSTSQSSDILLEATNSGHIFNQSVTNNPIVKDITINKTLNEASAEDETFVYEVTGPDGVFYCTITVPAGAVTASAVLKNMPIGDYTAKETAYNWRYSIDEASSYGFDGTVNHPFDAVDKDIKLTVESAGTYSFNFVNNLTSDEWSDGKSIVNNHMQGL